MDTITLQRIQTLHPKIRKTVNDAYLHVNNRLLGKGVRLRFAYTSRTHEEQTHLFAQGRTRLFDAQGKRLGKVTKANAGQSIHNYHLAWDIVLLVDTNGDGKFNSASWNTKADFDKDGIPDWKECADYFKSIGAVWGGDWTRFKDYPHFEITYGHTWRTLKQKYDKGDTFKEIINGREYVYVNL